MPATRRRRTVGVVRALLVLCTGTLYLSTAAAQLRLDITRGVENAVPIAVVPFGGEATGTPTDVSAIIAADLQRSGRFAPLPRAQMVDQPQPGDPIRFADWRLLKTDYLVVGRVENQGTDTAVTVRTPQRGDRSAPARRIAVGTQQVLAHDRASRRRPHLRAAHGNPRCVRHAHRVRRGRWQATVAALPAHGGRRGRLRGGENRRVERAVDVARLVARRTHARVRVIRGQSVGHLRAAGFVR